MDFKAELLFSWPSVDFTRLDLVCLFYYEIYKGKFKATIFIIDPELIVKNHQLQLILKQGPTVMLFTKREVLYPHKSHLSLVEQVIFH